MKRILLIGTGGTIASELTESGLTPELSTEQLLSHIPSISEFCRADCLQILNLDSTNIAPQHWLAMARCIREHYDDYDGFVVLHGTDTMAYSASALAFMLENLAKPVIFTGAQIPLGQIRTDGRDNIINSMLIAASGRVHEVCIYFNGLLLRGCRSVKRSSDQFEAFAAPNDTPLAFAGIQIQYKRSALRPVPEGEFRFQPLSELPIGVVKVFPGIQFAHFASLMTEKLRGVVLETFGAGNIPGAAQNALLPIIERAYQNGTIIVVCSQCSQGTVSLGTYASSAALHEVGAVNGHDMTTEAAFAKLYYLLSRSDDPEWVKGQLGRDLRGDLTE